VLEEKLIVSLIEMPQVRGLPNQTRIEQISIGLNEVIKLSKKVSLEERKNMEGI
jgi:hypothetical protein